MAKALLTPTTQIVVSIIFHLKGEVVQEMTNSRTSVQNELVQPKVKVTRRDSQGKDYQGFVSWT